MNTAFFHARYIAFALALCVAGVSYAAAAKGGNELYVETENAKLRSAPQFWSSPVASLHYGDGVTVVSEKEGGWLEVSTGGKKGFVHISALTQKKVILGLHGGAVGSKPDQYETVLAGKGFGKEVEQQYAATNSSVNLHAVNEMEKRSVSDHELAAFIQAGKLGTTADATKKKAR